MKETDSPQPFVPAADEYLAHVAPGPGGEYRVHALGEHLDSVADLAARSAAIFGASEWARLAGRWHDLGKYQPAFQSYIRRTSRDDPDARVEEAASGRVDHSTVGALHAVRHLGTSGARGPAVGRLLAYAIAGHHSGLPDWYEADGGLRALEYRLRDRIPNYEATVAAPGASAHIAGAVPPGGPPARCATALWLRMLFSALVDADFLDTEGFMDPAKARGRAGWRSLPDLADTFETFMSAKAHPDTKVNRVRAEILGWCREAAEWEPGLFSLTVPTGGGKTLSSMAFALAHALRHGKRRVVYVIPYTSILEQTADVFRHAFAEREPWTALLEHHSNLDDEAREAGRSRLASENWDAPVVVTTSVQFFESLFAARTSRVRKLHNLSGAVVVLDEVQLLPVDFLYPALDAIQMLADHFGASVLLMSATQPAWAPPPGSAEHAPGLVGMREIVPDPQELHRQLRRVEIQTPPDLLEPRTWEEVAEELLRHHRVLCIVNRRADARVLFDLLVKEDPETVHLSALMCGAHRSAAIAGIRARLLAGRGTRVVSTQLVEAGVDVDFPVVFRAMAGLDSIAQAAGRCNREGRLPSGEVHVFVPPTAPPPGILRQAENTCRTLLAEGIEDLLSPTAFRRFFRQLYWLRGENLDRYGIRDLLDHGAKRADLTYAFRTASDRFRIVRDEQQLPVVVRWSGHPKIDRVEQALSSFERGAPDRWAFRALQRSIVTVPRWNLNPLVASGAVRQIHDRLYLQEDTTLYDERLGLRLEPTDIRDPEELMP